MRGKGSACIALVAFSSVLCLHIALAQTKQAELQKHAFHWDSHAWQELTWRDSLEKANFSEADREALADVFATKLRPTLHEMGEDTDEKVREAALKTRVKMIDLNGDGIPEVVAQAVADCSPTGNCSLWILQKGQQGYRFILKGFGQTFTIQPSTTNGYHDVVVSMHGSATQAGLSDFRFTGRRYKKSGCYNAEWEVLEGDKVRELKMPRITPFPCSNY